MIFDSTYIFLVMIPTALITMFAQAKLKGAYGKWGRTPNERGMSGLETAKVLMSQRGLEHVKIESIPGNMTDHYDPRSKTMRLSQGSQQPTVAAMAIVAHELGHAEQDKTGNAMLNFRAALVPAANLGSGLGVWMIFGGLMLGAAQGAGLGTLLAWTGVLLFGAGVAFTLVTLPVEFDASRRAKRFLDDAGIVSPREAKGVDSVLDAAALTYVAAAAGSVLQMIYWISLIAGRRD